MAIENSRILSLKLGVTVPVKQGGAEQMPFENEEFDFVHANSVIEHVQDIERSHRGGLQGSPARWGLLV